MFRMRLSGCCAARLLHVSQKKTCVLISPAWMTTAFALSLQGRLLIPLTAMLPRLALAVTRRESSLVTWIYFLSF